MLDGLGEAFINEGLLAIQEAGDDRDDPGCLLRDVLSGFKPFTGRPFGTILVIGPIPSAFLLALSILTLHFLQGEISRGDYLLYFLFFLEYSDCFFGDF